MIVPFSQLLIETSGRVGKLSAFVKLDRTGHISELFIFSRVLERSCLECELPRKDARKMLGSDTQRHCRCLELRGPAQGEWCFVLLTRLCSNMSGSRSACVAKSLKR